MLLAHLVAVSNQVAATSSRLAKRDLIADVLREAAGSGEDAVDLAATYLSGVLRPRRTGVGYRSLGNLPSPAPEPTLTLLEVDARLDAISRLEGPGSQGRRRDEVASLFGAPVPARPSKQACGIGATLLQRT